MIKNDNNKYTAVQQQNALCLLLSKHMLQEEKHDKQFNTFWAQYSILPQINEKSVT